MLDVELRTYYIRPLMPEGECMKLTVRSLLLCLVCSIILPTAALAKKRPLPPPVIIAGVYEKFTVGQGSGDLEGMRVVIVAAGGGYHAIVQAAQGGAEDPAPEFVPVTVKGTTVNFAVGEMKYTGTVTAAGLRMKDQGLLKRKSCAE